MRSPADAAVSRIEGEQLAKDAISKIRRECTPGDVLSQALRDAVASGDAERLDSFLRTIERFIERAD